MKEATSHQHGHYHLRRRLLSQLDTDRTLKDLASEVGATDARVLRHLERMADEGLVEILGDGISWHRLDDAASLPDQEPTGVVFSTRLVEDFEDAYRELEDGLYGADAVQASGEHRTRLSTSQAAEFQDRLLALVAEYFAPGKGDRSGVKYGFHWVLTPIDLRPLDEVEPMTAPACGL
jgi:hypothetical protein